MFVLFLALQLASADIPPPPGYVEKCTVEKACGPEEVGATCRAYYGGRKDCEALEAKGFERKCNTRGASNWTEVLCSAKKPTPADAPTGATPAASAPPATAFLHSIEGTYGWQATGQLSYDFFPNGRVHIQGDDGEATMWEGTWQLSADQLTIASAELGDRKVTVARDGERLLLDGVAYSRYRP